MAKKLRLTGFSRLLIAMLFILPAAFFAGTYINGEDPMTFLKEKTGVSTPKKAPVQEATPSSSVKIEQKEVVETAIEDNSPALIPPAVTKKGEVIKSDDELTEQLNGMYDKNTALEDENIRLKKELEQLKGKMKAIDNQSTGQ